MLTIILHSNLLVIEFNVIKLFCILMCSTLLKYLPTRGNNKNQIPVTQMTAGLRRRNHNQSQQTYHVTSRTNNMIQ